MNLGKLVFSQLMAVFPSSTFRRCVATHRGDHKVQEFTCLDQFLPMAFTQLTYRESLRDIEVNLHAQAKRLYHLGLRCKTVSRKVSVNGGYAAIQRNNNQESLVKFGIVPEAVGRGLSKRLFKLIRNWEVRPGRRSNPLASHSARLL